MHKRAVYRDIYTALLFYVSLYELIQALNILIMTKHINTWIIASAIMIGLIGSGLFIGRAIQRFRVEERTISVKGLAEREVKSDMAVWVIQTKITTNDLVEGSRLIEINQSKIIEFLTSNGIKEDEIFPQNSTVSDKLAREYGSENIGMFRYIIEKSIQVRTNNVDVVSEVSKQTDKLMKVGVLITDSYNTLQYFYTGLNDIKPEMLSEATQNAKLAALEFTKESDVKLGKLKRANQGLFTIVDRDYSIMSPNYGAYSDAVYDIYKKVRVVVSIDYSVK